MKLYSYWRSSSSWRVRIGLNLKNLDYEYIAVHLLRDGGDQYRAYSVKNPMAQVPLLELEDEGQTLQIAQSLAILAYVDERFPDPPLLPARRRERAFCRELSELVNAGIQPLQNLNVLEELERRFPGANRDEWCAYFIGRGLSALERRAEKTAGQYLVGDQVTLADVCLVPQLYNARRFGVALDAYPTLCRAEAACNVLEAFVRAHPDRQPDAPVP
jgi:maleylpyruvate isomerase